MRPDSAPAEYLWFLNTLVQIRIPHDDGEDGISVIENWAPAGDSPPLHVHRTEDELFQVLEGEFRFVVGGEERRVGPGGVLLTRKGIPHTYRVVSENGGRWLTVTTRGDFERFVRTLSRRAESRQLPPPGGPPTAAEMEGLAAVAMRHHIELVGPPLT
jgi:quercetin dioxygenase-like cupin family protein